MCTNFQFCAFTDALRQHVRFTACKSAVNLSIGYSPPAVIRTPIAKNILDIIYEFKKLIKAKDKEGLLPWMNKVVALDIPELLTFVNGLNQDLDAVTNAIVSDHSNGLVEGTVNKIKVIKRIMYGRCRSDLLRSKCLIIVFDSTIIRKNQFYAYVDSCFASRQYTHHMPRTLA